MPPDDVPARVSALEGEVARLRAEVRDAGTDAQAARFLAAGADRDVTSVREELRAHTRVINALREDHVEFRTEMREFKVEMYEFRDEARRNVEQVNVNFAGVNANFAAVDVEFGEVHRRMQAGFDQAALDLGRVEGGLRADIGQVEASLRADIGQVESSLRADIGQVESSLRADIGQVESSLRAGIDEVIELVRRLPAE